MLCACPGLTESSMARTYSRHIALRDTEALRHFPKPPRGGQRPIAQILRIKSSFGHILRVKGPSPSLLVSANSLQRTI